MPDLFAHYAAAWVGTRPRRLRPHAPMVVLGTLLPDLAARAPQVVLGRLLGWDVAPFLDAFHTPLALLILCRLLSLWVVRAWRRRAFYALLAGSALHMAMDLLQAPFHRPAYMPLFPFSREGYHLPFYHYNGSMALFPVLALLLLGLYWWQVRRGGRTHEAAPSGDGGARDIHGKGA